MNRIFVALRAGTALCGLAVLLFLVACGAAETVALERVTVVPADPTDPISTPDNTGTLIVVDPLGVAPPHPDFLPSSLLCSTDPQLTPLQFEDISSPDPDLPDIPVRRASYRSDLNQEWQIVVRAGSAEALAAFTADGTLKICAEAIPGWSVDPDALAGQIAPSLYPIVLMLVAETSLQNNAPAAELSQRSETPRDIIFELGGSPDAVVDGVIERIKDAQQAGSLADVDPAWLTAFEADTFGAVDALLDEPGLFIGLHRADSRPLAQILREEPLAVVVEILPAGQLAQDFQKDGGVIAYVFDPPVSPGAPNYFVAHCTTYAYAQASLESITNNGTLALVLRKIGSGSDSDSASAAAPTTKKLEGSNGTAVTFDVEVSATQAASYTIAGNWLIGAGGACVNQ